MWNTCLNIYNFGMYCILVKSILYIIIYFTFFPVFLPPFLWNYNHLLPVDLGNSDRSRDASTPRFSRSLHISPSVWPTALRHRVFNAKIVHLEIESYFWWVSTGFGWVWVWERMGLGRMGMNEDGFGGGCVCRRMIWGLA